MFTNYLYTVSCLRSLVKWRTKIFHFIWYIKSSNAKYALFFFSRPLDFQEKSSLIHWQNKPPYYCESWNWTKFRRISRYSFIQPKIVNFSCIDSPSKPYLRSSYHSKFHFIYLLQAVTWNIYMNDYLKSVSLDSYSLSNGIVGKTRQLLFFSFRWLDSDIYFMLYSIFAVFHIVQLKIK